MHMTCTIYSSAHSNMHESWLVYLFNTESIWMNQFIIGLDPVLSFTSFFSREVFQTLGRYTVLESYLVCCFAMIEVWSIIFCHLNIWWGIYSCSIQKSVALAQLISLYCNALHVLLFCSMVGDWPLTIWRICPNASYMCTCMCACDSKIQCNDAFMKLVDHKKDVQIAQVTTWGGGRRIPL